MKLLLLYHFISIRSIVGGFFLFTKQEACPHSLDSFNTPCFTGVFRQLLPIFTSIGVPNLLKLALSRNYGNISLLSPMKRASFTVLRESQKIKKRCLLAPTNFHIIYVMLSKFFYKRAFYNYIHIYYRSQTWIFQLFFELNSSFDKYFLPFLQHNVYYVVFHKEYISTYLRH